MSESGYVICWTCVGNGWINVPQPGAWGSKTCPDCHGTGRKTEKKKD